MSIETENFDDLNKVLYRILHVYNHLKIKCEKTKKRH